MKNSGAVCAWVMLALPVLAAAQTGQGSGTGAGAGAGSESIDAQATTPASSPSEQKGGKPTTSVSSARMEEALQRAQFVRTLTNVQVELTLTDQVGTAAPDKKTVSMIVASGNWGKIRNTAARVGPTQIGLNVDARPFVSTDGPIQLELTIYYYPPNTETRNPTMPTELNQSMTVVLQNGKSMQISQAADPTMDRKVTIDAKATVLK